MRVEAGVQAEQPDEVRGGNEEEGEGMSYDEAVARYSAGSGHNRLFELFTRMLDFEMLDYELEECADKPTAKQVDRILDEYNELIVSDDDLHWAKVGHMQTAIGRVMGREYLGL